MFKENMTWWNADRICKSKGGHLAFLDDDYSRSTCTKRALQTCFRDGRQISMAYVNSKTDTTGSSSCSIYMEKGKPELVNCSEEHPFICERPIRKYYQYRSAFLLRSSYPYGVNLSVEENHMQRYTLYRLQALILSLCVLHLQTAKKS